MEKVLHLSLSRTTRDASPPRPFTPLPIYPLTPIIHKINSTRPHLLPRHIRTPLSHSAYTLQPPIRRHRTIPPHLPDHIIPAGAFLELVWRKLRRAVAVLGEIL
jgi:hypothetical protein